MRIAIDVVIDDGRLVQLFPYGEKNGEHCIHGIKLRWGCESCEDYLDSISTEKEKMTNANTPSDEKVSNRDVAEKIYNDWVKRFGIAGYYANNNYKEDGAACEGMIQAISQALDEASMVTLPAKRFRVKIYGDHEDQAFEDGRYRGFNECLETIKNHKANKHVKFKTEGDEG